MHNKIYVLCIFLLGINHFLFSQNPKLDSLLTVLKTSAEDTGKVSLYITIAQNEVSRDSHFVYIKRALRLAQTTNNQTYISRCEYFIGAYHTDNSELDSARYYFERSLTRLKSVPQTALAKKIKFALLYGLATIFMKKQDVTNTLYYAEQMQQYGRETHHDKSEMLSYHILGSLYTQNDSKIALGYFVKGLKIAEETQNIHMEFSFISNIANCYKEQKNYIEEEKALNKALVLSHKMQDERAIAYNLFALGILNNNKQNYTKAVSYLEKSLVSFRNLGEKFYITTNLSELAEANLAFNNLSLALSQAQEAAKIAKSQKLWQQLNAAYHVMHLIYAEMGDYKNAYESMEQQQMAKDSVFNQEKTTILTEFQTKFEVSQKTKENDWLKKEQTAQKRHIRTQNIIIVLVFVAFLIASLLGLTIYNGRKREKSLNNILNQQKTELQNKNRLLEELNAVKDRLFSIISHDLRAPLISLKGLLSLLNDNTLSENQVSALFPKLAQEVGYTFDLLDSLLYWAKSQLNGIHTNPKKIDIRTLVNENINLLNNLAEQKNISLTSEITTDSPAFADEDMTRTILRNLISNALKFTKVNGKVHIDVKKIADSLQISITDTGIGIPAATLSQLFTGNISTRGTKNEKGTGLGLILVKDFVEKNEGTISVESEVGKGSIFIITLPSADEMR